MAIVPDSIPRASSKGTPPYQLRSTGLTEDIFQVKRTVKLVTEQNPTYVSLSSSVAATSLALPSFAVEHGF